MGLEGYFTDQEIEFAKGVVLKRYTESRKQNLEHNPPLKDTDDPLKNEFEGALAETAFAKEAKIPYTGDINTFKNPDVGFTQQKGTTVEWGSLIVRPNDKGEDAYVLVILLPNNKFRIVGWLRGKDARRDEWIKNPDNRGAAHFVHQRDLHPISSKQDIDDLVMREGLRFEREAIQRETE